MSTDVQPIELVELFAENVRARRLELGLTQAELADRLDCHIPYVSDLENAKKAPFLGNLARLAEALETVPDALIARREPTIVGKKKASRSKKTA